MRNLRGAGEPTRQTTMHPPLDAMSKNESRITETTALDAIRGVVDMVAPERLRPTGNGGTADLRVTLPGKRTADIEVTTNTDGPARAFMDAASVRKGEQRIWPTPRLSHKWSLSVADHCPTESKKCRSVRRLVKLLELELRQVENAGGTPEEMLARAERELRRSPEFSSPRFAHPRQFGDNPRLWPDPRGGHAQNVRSIEPPVPARAGCGSMALMAASLAASAGHESLVAALQNCIKNKVAKDQMHRAPDRKWLAVVLKGLAQTELCGMIDPGRPQPPPRLDGVSFTYFDEVWAIGEDGPNFVILRLSAHGNEQLCRVVARDASAQQ